MSLPGIDSRVALSQSRARVVPLLLALTALPSFLALKSTAQKLSQLDLTLPFSLNRVFASPAGQVGPAEDIADTVFCSGTRS